MLALRRRLPSPLVLLRSLSAAAKPSTTETVTGTVVKIVYRAGDFAIAQFRRDAGTGDQTVLQERRPTVFTLQGSGGVLSTQEPGDHVELHGEWCRARCCCGA
jgi:hypothetical protein